MKRKKLCDQQVRCRRKAQKSTAMERALNNEPGSALEVSDLEILCVGRIRDTCKDIQYRRSQCLIRFSITDMIYTLIKLRILARYMVASVRQVE